MLSSQPVLVLSFAIAFGVLGATVTARGASMKMQRCRIIRMSAYAATAVVIGYAVVTLHLHFNFTSSVPLGIYRLLPVPRNVIQRGMLVAVCAPSQAAELGRRRAYLASGPCHGDTELLLKFVAAAAGDDVAVSAWGVAVNGCLLARSQPLSVDAAGRRLSPAHQGHYRLRSGQVWLYADNDRSWDSRYWGPVPVSAISARAFSLLSIPPLRLTSGQPRCSAASRFARGRSDGRALH